MIERRIRARARDAHPMRLAFHLLPSSLLHASPPTRLLSLSFLTLYLFLPHHKVSLSPVPPILLLETPGSPKHPRLTPHLEIPAVPRRTLRTRPRESPNHVSARGLFLYTGTIKASFRTFPCFTFILDHPPPIPVFLLLP